MLSEKEIEELATLDRIETYYRDTLLRHYTIIHTFAGYGRYERRLIRLNRHYFPLTLSNDRKEEL